MAEPDQQPTAEHDQGNSNEAASQDKETIRVEVAYAKPNVQVIVPMEVPPTTTAAMAIQRSELAARFAELEPLTYKYGIFGKVCKPDQVLREGDRVEIYRPLIADPKKVRKERAAKGKKTRKGAKAIGKEPPPGEKTSTNTKAESSAKPAKPAPEPPPAAPGNTDTTGN